MSPSISVSQATANVQALLSQFSTPGGFMLAALLNPNSFPQVTVGGEPFEMRLSLRSKIFLEKRYKIPFTGLSAWLGKHHETGCYASMMAVVAGAMLGRMVDGKWKAMPLDEDQLIDVVSEAEWAKIEASYVDALGKATAGLKLALDSLPKPTPEPMPEPISEVQEVVN